MWNVDRALLFSIHRVSVILAFLFLQRAQQNGSCLVITVSNGCKSYVVLTFPKCS